MSRRRVRSRPLVLVAGILLLAVPSSAQQVLRIDPAFACGAEPSVLPEEVYLFGATQAAEDTIRELVDYLGLSGSRLQLKAANVSNAIAYLDPLTQERIILYDESFVRGLREDSASVWVGRAILAHELAHHLEGHLQRSDPGRRKQEELEADRFAGNMLFKLDADLDAVTAVFASLKEGEGYPPRSARIAAATNGWWSAKEQSDYEPGEGETEDQDESPVPGPKQVAEVPWTVPGDSPVPGTMPVQVGLSVQYSPAVVHSGGLAGGPGVTFQLRGRIEVPRHGLLGAVVVFDFPDGRTLFPHPQEAQYRRIPDGRLVTGSRTVPVPAGPYDLAFLAIDPIPHYALNLVPTAYRTTYTVRATAWIYLDDDRIAISDPIDFTVVW